MDRILRLLILLLMVSCVGTVQDAKVKLNSLFEEDKITLNFGGIDEARAISHNKIEIEFTPSGEVSPNLKYLLYVNNALSPIEINPDSLDKAASGRVRYLVDNLSINSKYKLKLRLKNNLTQAMSKNEKEVTVDTFDNKTADFKGITSVSKVNGQSDSTIRVDWVSAIMEGSTSTGPWDPLYYEITIIGSGGVANLNNSSYTGPDRKKIRVPPTLTDLSPFNYTKWTNLVIGSLQPNTQYYVQVRAVNKLYDEFLNIPGQTIIPVNKEVNTKFMTIKTDPATGVFDYNTESFRVQPGPGAQAKSRLVNTWLPASGSYVGYRLFYIQCSGAQCNSESEVLGTDLLTDEVMEDIVDGSATSGSFVETNVLTSATTSYVLTGLTEYKWYQLKLVACRNAACSKTAGDAIASTLRAVRTAPILAPFSGITAIQHPDSSTSLAQINAQFDIPDLSTGFADRMELFCIDPDSVTEAQNNLDYTLFSNDPTVAISGSPVTRCNGLSLCGPNSSNCADGAESLNYSVSSGTNIRIKGIKNDGTKYCFAAAPAIREELEQLPVSHVTKDWIIRCITPEVKTPTIAQFPGANSSCGVVNNSITVSWPKPVAGIYSAYRVLWRKIDGNETFSFSSAATDAGTGNINNPTPANPYFASPTLDPDTLTYTLSNLRPGARYKVGVLTQTTGAGPIKWSEFNTNVKDCVTAMPKYKFDEWTRIFAIGPKTDGRFPYMKDYVGATSVRSIKPQAYLFEAINNDGVPYELSIDSNGEVDVDGRFFKAPGSYSGSYSPSGYADDFDGAPGNGGLIAASNSGIVSLAWKDVSLDFSGGEFKECQINAGDAPVNTYCFNNNGSYSLPAQKKLRRYGYKVYRSADNRLSWQDITKSTLDADTATGSSLVYATDYKYYKRADLPEQNERMAFFTDYSVQAIKADPTVKSRARIYWYRIVPYFDNKVLGLDASQSGLANPPNEIKVILPPDNMALVHRWMSNRQACNELERGASIDKMANYTCAFNGFGAKAKGFPWNPTNTVVDLGGHMLIDRFELGCNFTRGDVDSIPVSNGNSEFNRENQNFDGWKSRLSTFKGYATDANGVDATAKRFSGCASAGTVDVQDTLVGRIFGGLNTTLSSYRQIVHGDCMSAGTMTLASTSCAASPDTANYYRWNFPGAFLYRDVTTSFTSSFDCADGTPDKPTTVDTLLSPAFRQNIVIQSEYAAVLHHMSPENGRQISFQGPTGDIVNYSSGDGVWGKPTSCYINLAAIGTDGNWIARWVGAGDLDILKGQTNVASATMGQIKANANLFNSTTYKAPGAGFMNDNRFTDDTKIGRVISSNAAKLPPITNLSVTGAQQLCNAYEVEVGFSNNGSNFLSLSLPKQKRLLGRQELISASAWPDASDNGFAGNFNYRETTSSARIKALEGVNQAGYCATNGKAVGVAMPEHSTSFRSQTTRIYWQAGTTGVNNGDASLIGGSSDNDGPIHSELCTSKYGIQDIVGNAAEITTDRLFCDYGADKLYFGRLESGQGYENESARMPDYDGSGSEEDIIWLGAKVIKETGTGDVELISGTGTQGKMWADISPNSGYCSIVDATDPGGGYPALANRFRDINNNFNNVFKPDGTLNTDMILRSNPIEQKNIDKLRNGDGYYLSFGTNTPGPYLQRSNSWAISTTGYTHQNGMALGPYFNPIIGIPMKCPGSTCDNSEDNMMASTKYFMDDPDAPKPTVEPTIPRFPAGNSQLLNQGISETIYNNGTTSFSIDFDDPIRRRGLYDVVYEIRIKLNGTVEYLRKPMREWAISEFGSYSNASVQYFSKLRFLVPREASLQLVHGGDAQSSVTGRYTVGTMVSSAYYAKRSTTFTAARCGVLIED